MDKREESRITLSNELLYLFNTGKLHHAYRHFGAQIMEDGVRFAVWAPDVRSVKVIGDFNGWGNKDPEHLGYTCEDCYLEQIGTTGVFAGFLPGLKAGERYKYDITTAEGRHLIKADPFAFCAQLRPETASIVADLQYQWHDHEWMEDRKHQDFFRRPINIYEIHLGSWMRHPNQADGFYSYDELADRLIPYIIEMGYTHVELMPVMEHPLDASWGYQVTGYFAATSRYGEPTGLMRLIDRCHQAGIGVILDWVPGHFCPDAHGLASFNGGMLYEKEIHPEWGTYKFDFGRSEVRSFLMSNASFWMEKYHADGLRVDGVSSMLYLNFGKTNQRDFIYNKDGGDTDLDAISFIREFNQMIGSDFPGTFTAAEESSAFPLVTSPPEVGGLGFHFKWNMGWMNDTLDYMSTDFIYRKYDHNKMTFAMTYAYSENYILPLSHDEVVHGKKSLIGRMPGDMWRKFAGMRTLAMYHMTHPGKKLNFMGNENAPFIEWREYEELEWFMLQYENHAKYRDYVKALNCIYRDTSALWSCDSSWDGFRWIDCDNSEQSILSYVRMAELPEDPVEMAELPEDPVDTAELTDEGEAEADAVIPEFEPAIPDTVAVIINFNIEQYDKYRIGVPFEGEYTEILNSDSVEFGGNDLINPAVITADEIPMHGQPYSIELRIPALGGIILKRMCRYKDD